MVFLEHLSEHPLDYIAEFYNSEKFRVQVCPHCHTKRKLHLHGVYHRYVIWYEDIYSIPIQRHFCFHCGKTVSVLPSFCHPRFQLALPIIIKLLLAFFNNTSFPFSSSYQHERFIVNRFLLYMNRIIEFFRIFYDPLITFPVLEHEKAIKILEIITSSGKPEIFAKRFTDHFKKGFMAH